MGTSRRKAAGMPSANVFETARGGAYRRFARRWAIVIPVIVVVGLQIDAIAIANSLAITAAAASLGAPFWFDVLNRLGSLRNVGNKPKADT